MPLPCPNWGPIFRQSGRKSTALSVASTRSLTTRTSALHSTVAGYALQMACEENDVTL
jgi:hypothetical protein